MMMAKRKKGSKKKSKLGGKGQWDIKKSKF